MKTQALPPAINHPKPMKSRLFHLGLALLTSLALLSAPTATLAGEDFISVNPNRGPLAGGNTVEITLSIFDPASVTVTSVTFDNQMAMYQRNGATINAIVPQGTELGPVVLEVKYTNPIASPLSDPETAANVIPEFSLTTTYTYEASAPTVTNVSPTTTPAVVPTGGISVTLTGTNLSGITGIAGFSALPIPVTAPTATSLTFTIPAGTYPVGPVRASVTDGSANVPFNFGFTRVGNPTLSITRIIPSATTPNNVGLITLRAPSGTFTALTPATAATQTSRIRPGTQVTLSTTARPGFLFNSWTDSENVGTELGRSFSFTMPDADVSIDAEFVANPFPSSPATTNFRGIISPDFNTPRSNATFGSVVVTVTGRTGDFSGNFLNDGRNLAIRGYFLGDGSVWFTQTSGVSANFPFAGASKVLDLSLDNEDDFLSLNCSIESNTPLPQDGNIANVIESSSSSGTALPHLTSVPSSIFNRASVATGPINEGYFNAILSPSPEGGFSIGDCHAHITISSLGRVSVVGKLSDGSSLSMSSNVCNPGIARFGPFSAPIAAIPLHSQLRTPGGTASQLGGSLIGLLAIQDPSYYSYPTDQPVAGDPGLISKLSIGGSLTWLRPAVTQIAGTTTLARETQIYTAGWPEGLPVYVEGSQYDANITIESALASSFFPLAPDAVTPPPAPGNAVLNFTDGKLVTSISKTNFNINASSVAKIIPIDRSYTLTLNQRTGQIAGSFTPNWTPRSSSPTTFTGVIIQAVSDPRLSGLGPVNAGFGAGFFISNRPGDLDPESGDVRLSSPIVLPPAPAD